MRKLTSGDLKELNLLNKIFKNNSYTNKVLRTSVANVNKDKTR